MEQANTLTMQENIKKYGPEVLLIGFILLIPFHIRASNLMLLAWFASLLFVGDLKQRWERLASKRLFYLYIGFFGLHLFGMLYTEDWARGVIDLDKKLVIFFFPFALLSEEIKPHIFKLRLYAFWASLVALIGVLLWFNYGMFFNFSGDINDLAFREAMTETPWVKVGHVYLGLFLTWTIIMILAIFLKLFPLPFSKLEKACLFFLALLMIFTLVKISARMAILSLLCVGLAMVLVALTQLRHKGYALGLLLGLLLFGALLGQSKRVRFMLENSFPTEIRYDSPYWYDWTSGSTIRMAIWNSAWQTFTWESAVLGTGTGSPRGRLRKGYEKMNFKFALEKSFNAHNQFLETYLGLGLIGLAYWLACFFIPVYQAFRYQYYLLFFFLLLFFLSGLTESVLTRQKGVVFYAFWNSLLTAQMLKPRGPSS